MKDFDINNIGKEMPYKAPNEDFFEKFTEDLLSKVEQKPKRVFSLKAVIAPALGLAAALAVILTVVFSIEPDGKSTNKEYTISDNVDESIDSFLNSLSDEELAYLASDSSYSDDFYSNIPNI